MRSIRNVEQRFGRHQLGNRAHHRQATRGRNRISRPERYSCAESGRNQALGRQTPLSIELAQADETAVGCIGAIALFALTRPGNRLTVQHAIRGNRCPDAPQGRLSQQGLGRSQQDIARIRLWQGLQLLAVSPHLPVGYCRCAYDTGSVKCAPQPSISPISSARVRI